ncbi:MAG: glycosyltransferase [Bacteroidales bacterium]|nr:glycosyltransferase [Bacteroidales bacterium]
MKISVILPTYNEKDSINHLIREIDHILELENYNYEIVIVDDMSPDGTHDAIIKEFSDNPRVIPILRKNEKGLATAILHGIRYSTGNKIVIMDTDFNHPPNLIPLLVKITDYFDIAIGSRYVIGGGMETSKLRFIGSKVFNKFIHYMLGVRTTDNLSGYFAFNKEILDKVDAGSIFYGYGDYFIRFLYVMQKQNKFILEIPVTYKDRKGGLSKTNLKAELIRYTCTVLKIRFGIWTKSDSK